MSLVIELGFIEQEWKRPQSTRTLFKSGQKPSPLSEHCSVPGPCSPGESHYNLCAATTASLVCRARRARKAD